MTDINRRNFLFGTIASAAAGALVLRPTSDVVELFRPTLGEVVAVQRSTEQMSQWSDKLTERTVRYDPVDLGEMVFNHKGEPLGIVRDIIMHADPDHMDVTGFGDNNRSFVPRPVLQAEITVVTYGPVNLKSWARFERK